MKWYSSGSFPNKHQDFFPDFPVTNTTYQYSNSSMLLMFWKLFFYINLYYYNYILDIPYKIQRQFKEHFSYMQ